MPLCKVLVVSLIETWVESLMALWVIVITNESVFIKELTVYQSCAPIMYIKEFLCVFSVKYLITPIISITTETFNER